MTADGPAGRKLEELLEDLQLGELLRFRHVVRHLYAYELDAEQVLRLLHRVRTLWPEVTADLDQFTAWLRELRAGF